ncbi:hypothetical protein SUGI_0126970 [Cryptomeria japonica]|uniref:uncharacterized protein LOC131049155 n=1 Tax=Cryptomeria japonica TaxID=3369 RepID=UPI002408D4D4|nr:uncharacterized protein LOC131049155 [Cryptomeria japonica]GLJ10368.1 hypothetical protein SUGI_0126970 [Cryptomeria japonica]
MAMLSVAGVFFFIAALAAADHRFESTSAPGFTYTRRTIPHRPSTAIANRTGKAACTAKYWGMNDRKEAWPRMVPVSSSVAKVFGSQALEAYGPTLTLLQAMAMKEGKNDGYSSLIKESSAALVNAYGRPGFLFTAWRVKTLLIQSLVSEEAASAQAARFRIANQACS